MVNDLVKNGSLNKLERELKKCLPLCASCHREVHASEREV